MRKRTKEIFCKMQITAMFLKGISLYVQNVGD